MKKITKSLILIALAISVFIGCSSGGGSSSSSNKDDTNTTVPIDTNTTIEDINISTSYILNSLANRDIPSTASLLAQTEDTKVKITRDVESDMMNVYVLSGSVKVTELVVSQ